jgi:WD40 repeat protein
MRFVTLAALGLLLAACTPTAAPPIPTPAQLPPARIVAAATAPPATAVPLPPSAIPTAAPPTSVPATPAPTRQLTIAPITLASPTATPLFPEQSIDAGTLGALRPLRTIGMGRAVDAAFAPDGKLLAVATTAGLALFELPMLRPLRFDQIDGGVTELAFGRDGSVVALATAASIDGRRPAHTELRRVADGAHVASLPGDKPVFSPDGRTLATVEDSFSRTPTTRLWRVADGARVAQLAGEAPVFSPDGRFLTTRDALYDDPPPTVTLRDPSGARIAEIAGGSTAFSPDGRTLAVGDTASVRLLRLPDAQPVATLTGTPQGAVSALAFSADGRRLRAAAAGEILEWDTASGARLSTHVAIQGPAPLVFSPDGATLAYANVPDSTPTPGQHLRRIAESQAIYDDEQSVAVSFSADSRFAALVGYAGQVRVLSLDNATTAEIVLPGFYSLAFSPDAQTLATAGQGVYLWRATEGTMQQSLGAPELANDPSSNGVPWQRLRYSRDGTTLAVEGRYNAFEATIGAATAWDLTDGGRERWSLELGGVGYYNYGKYAGASSPSGLAAYTEDGSTIALVYSDGVTKTLSVPDVTALALGDDGATLAVGTRRGTVELFATATGMPRATLPAQAEVRDLFWSADGTLLAAYRADDTLLVWRTGEPAPFAQITGLAGLRALAFTIDKELLIIGSAAGVAFYQLADGRLLHTLPVAADDLAIGPRRRLLAVLHDGMVQLWGIGRG